MLIQADAFRLPYPDGLFHACVTSPPYWGLRKYTGDQGEEPLGLEATPERHIERLVEVFREVRRVLRDDGVVWLNYGDCFGGSWGNYGSRDGGQRDQTVKKFDRPGSTPSDMRPGTSNQTSGNLMLMPHRLAIALQSDGWIVRNDLVWFKRNPMPESVSGWTWQRHRIKTKKSKHATEHNIKGGTEAMLRDASIHQGISEDWLPDYVDCPGCEKCNPHNGYILKKGSFRHTRAHEYVFMLTKQMQYFCNQEVVREASSENTHHRGTKLSPPKEAAGVEEQGHQDFARLTPDILPTRNPRSVLDVPTAPYKGAHYATFPPKLIAPLIRASVPRRCCPECGMAWAPVVEKGTTFESGSGKAGSQVGDILGKHQATETLHSGDGHDVRLGPTPTNTVTDYRPTCECGIEEHEPGIVLDIFGGSGTTGMVAKQLLRRWVVMDISHPYLDEQAKVRTGTGAPVKSLAGLPMFEEIEA